MDFHTFPLFFMCSKGSGARMFGSLSSLVRPCRNGLDPPNMKISDSGDLVLESWCLDAWMLEGLEVGGC